MSDDAHTLIMDRFVDRIERLHTAPQVACQVLTVLRDPEFDTRRLVQCLEADPALAASVLRLVNSSYFGLARHIGSLRDAVTYLGSRSLRLAVLSFGLLKALAADAPAHLYQDYWRRSLTMGSVSSRLAGFKPELPADDAYCAGLLSDVGMLLLAQLETTSYVNLYQRTGHSTLLVESERELYGFDHGALGARLMHRWSLPECLTKAVAGHHAPCVPDDPFPLVVYVSNLISDALWTPRAPQVHEARRLLDSEFGVGTDGFITLAVECKRAINESARIYQVHFSRQIDCDELLREAQRQYREEAMEAAIDWDSLAAVAGDDEAI